MITQDTVYRDAGFGNPVPRGNQPAIVVVDFTYGFTDTQYPTAANMTAQIAATRRLTDLARKKYFPVIYTTISFQLWERDTYAWLNKATGMRSLLAGTRMVEIDKDTGIQDDDPVIIKHGASAFFGTNLAALLYSAHVDTLIVTGATTSGCVRATVVDAVQSGFNVLVPRDCVADRAAAPHEANLYDMHQKYADVVDADNVLAWLNDVGT